MRRYTELIAKGATTQLNLDNAITQSSVLRGQVAADELAVDNLRVQIGYCTIRAPISGRASMAAVKVGNFVRSADQAPLATIIQAAPVYVSFPVPQRSLPDLREALTRNTAAINASIPGDMRQASGQVTMIENTVDPDHRHGHGAGHHAEHRRFVVARHTGNRALDLPRRGSGDGPIRGRPGEPDRILRLCGEEWRSHGSTRHRRRAASTAKA